MEHSKKQVLFRRGDWVAILIVVALIGALWGFYFRAEKGNTIEISVNGTVVHTLSLKQNGVYPVEANGHRLIVHVEGGEAFVTDADCPDKVCEHTGKISRAGASIVCSAAHVSVRIKGGGDADVDFVAG